MTAFKRVCKQIVSEGKALTCEEVRSWLLLNIVRKIRKLVEWHEENREQCHEVFIQ